MLILDQADDTSDTGGVFVCSQSSMATCSTDSEGNGRIIAGANHSQQQTVWVTAVSGSGSGPYTVTISNGVYFKNFRTVQNPGAWWPNQATNDGIENLTIDYTNNSVTGSNLNGIGMFGCYQCWIKNIRSINGGRNHVLTGMNLQSVVRDSYFYGAQTPGTSQSYGVEINYGTSGVLVENNIFQQTTAPIMWGSGSGQVIGFNFTVDNINSGANMQVAYYAHGIGSQYNLWEGNNLNGINDDSTTFGANPLGTLYRNFVSGWQLGKTQYTYPVSLGTWSRVFNVMGNVLGQPGYAVTYESYATSATAGVNGGDPVNTSVYALGWTGYNGWGGCGGNPNGTPPCGPLVRTTLARWGNWDVVTNGAKWDSTEASPAAVTYTNANFTSTYFGSLAHTLPASLYNNAKPSWWPAAKAWPPVGPDVSSGNLGICTGTFAGVAATAAGQCTAGTKNTAWGGAANSIPAMDCYLTTMAGPVDGSGSVRSFDANTCYSSLSSPTVTTTTATSITNTSAASGGTVASNGGASVTSEGVCYATTANPTTPCTSDGTATPFTSSITGLTLGTVYHYRAFATNSAGTGYGSDLTFTTTGGSAPTVTTTTASGITQSLATSGGTVTSNGGSTITSEGVCYSTIASPTTPCTSDGTATPFTSSLTGLSSSTTYHYRAFAANGVGTSYGSDLTFTTLAPDTTIPVVIHTTFCGAIASWPGTCVIPATTAGNGLVVSYSSYTGSTGPMTSVTDGGDSFGALAGAASVNAAGPSWNDTWASSNVAAGRTSVTVTPSSTQFGDVYVWEVQYGSFFAGCSALSNQTATTVAVGATTSVGAKTLLLASLHPSPGATPTGVNSPFISDLIFDTMGYAEYTTTAPGTYGPQWPISATTFATTTCGFQASGSVTNYTASIADYLKMITSVPATVRNVRSVCSSPCKFSYIVQ